MKHIARLGAIAAMSAAILMPTLPARAADNLIPGKILIIKDTKLIKMVAKPVTTFTVPTPSGPGDPTLAGGNLTIIDTGDGLGLTIALPAGGWRGSGNPPGSYGYRYRGAGTPSDPCEIVIVKSAVIKFVCRDDQALDPPLTGKSGITLALGTENYCAEFGGTTVKNVAGLLKRKDAPPPGACPSLAACCGLPSDPMTTASFHSFTVAAAAGDCGDRIDVFGNAMDLDCSKLYAGGGANSVPLPITSPDLGQTVTAITACTGQTATLGAATSAETGSNRNCSGTGCFFAAPLPIPNPGTPPTSTCILNRISGPASGTLDCSTGAESLSVPLDRITYLTGDTATDPLGIIIGVQPCPLCSGGTCIGGPNNGLGCTAETSDLGDEYPTSLDCPPDPMFDIGTLPISFNLTSGSVSWTATRATNDTEVEPNQTRVFSGYCRDVDITSGFEIPARQCWENGMAVGLPCTQPEETCEQRSNGAFGPNGGGAMTITVIGTPQAALLSGAAAGTLVSVFSIALTGNATVDASEDRPGPGALTLRGTGELCADAMACP